MYVSEELQSKWQPILEHPDLEKIADPHRRAVTSILLENQEKAAKEDKVDGTNEFIGEDIVGNKSKNEKIEINTGESFDVKSEYKEISFDIKRCIPEVSHLELL